MTLYCLRTQLLLPSIGMLCKVHDVVHHVVHVVHDVVYHVVHVVHHVVYHVVHVVHHVVYHVVHVVHHVVYRIRELHVNFSIEK